VSIKRAVSARAQAAYEPLPVRLSPGNPLHPPTNGGETPHLGSPASPLSGSMMDTVPPVMCNLALVHVGFIAV